MKLQSVGVFVYPHGWLVREGCDLKASDIYWQLIPHLPILDSLYCLKSESYCQLYAGKKNGAKFAHSLSLNAQIYASSSSYYGIIATACLTT
ncbi:hypothetical protein, partial [uncultured Virgibacillus sp.]|uniref:hypothetical protein n=1 Tax=uncultured Virgibacillus sp. TaxID=417355 RepID=UPI0026151299